MDYELACYCNRLGAGSIDWMTETLCSVTFLLIFWCLLLVVVFRLDRGRARKILLTVLLAVAFHVLVNELLLKHLLVGFYPMRLRPYVAHPGDIVCVGYPFADSSFPSSHAASTAAIGTVLGYYFRRAAPLFAVFCVAMAFSRVHNGMHYPSDVLSGTFFGILYGAAAIDVMVARPRRKARKAETAAEAARPAGPPD